MLNVSDEDAASMMMKQQTRDQSAIEELILNALAWMLKTEFPRAALVYSQTNALLKDGAGIAAPYQTASPELENIQCVHRLESRGGRRRF